MSTRSWTLLVGALMTLGGVALFLGFYNVETPIVGLRQVGLVVAVLGVLELAAGAWMAVSGRGSSPQDK